MFLSKIDLLVVLSRHMENYYSEILPNSNFEVIYNGLKPVFTDMEIDEQDRKLFHSYQGKCCILGSIAGLTDTKGIDQIIQYLYRNKKSVYFIIGDGDSKSKLVSLAKKLNVSDRCFFLGFRKNAYKYLKYFDIYAMPSRSEGFPIALLEAAFSKKPVLCSNLPVFKEIFSEMEVAFFEIENIDSLEMAMHDLEKNKEYYSKNIYNKYNSCYTDDHMGKKYLSAYLEVTS
jgi:glycosyltransferase involved in cell wall biosynthesis